MHGLKPDQHILVPIDFSKHSEKALLYAARLAKGLSMELLVLHVIHDPADDPGYYHHRKVKKMVRRIEDDAQDMMASYFDKLVKKHPKVALFKTAKVELVTGLPVTRIIEVAEKTRPFMMVLGSQGRTGLSRMLIGSKAETVLRLATIPVTLVK